jgi:hypothetical protein
MKLLLVRLSVVEVHVPIGVPFDYAQGDIMVKMLYEIASFLAMTHKKTANLSRGGFDFYSEITFPFLS